MKLPSAEHQVLHRFGLEAGRLCLHPLGNAGGMSGAALWRVESTKAVLCLRRWPREHPSEEHLIWIHRQLRRARAAGCGFVPAPLAAADGATAVRHAGDLWELTPWMPGQADYHLRPSPAKLAAALQALAGFHQATVDSSEDRIAPSPGLEERRNRLRDLDPHRCRALLDRVTLTHGSEVAQLSRQILDLLPACLETAAFALEHTKYLATPLQPCLRDVWHDHVLFEGQRVAGMVDFGAMRVESPAGDIARLLGSLAANNGEGWRTGLKAYQSIRPMTRDQHRQLAAFDAANITLAGLNWVQWLFVEGRRFEDRSRVVSRLAEIFHRVDQFAKQVWPLRAEL